jgi:hypothetical protein
VTVYNAFLDSLQQQLEDRFQPATKAAVMLSAFFPRYAIDVCFEDVREGCVLFSNYLDGTILDVEIEYKKLSKSLDGPPFASSTKCTSTRDRITAGSDKAYFLFNKKNYYGFL